MEDERSKVTLILHGRVINRVIREVVRKMIEDGVLPRV